MSRDTDRARKMRKSLTPPEARLWAVLKRLRSDGFHFRKQAPFRGYSLDFVGFSRRLVVEVDGGFHSGERRDQDATRDGVLAREGFKTLRYSNADVRDNADFVMMQIRAELEARPLVRGNPLASQSAPG